MTDLQGKFYTDVSVRGNNILCRYTDNITGEQGLEKIPFKPKLWVQNPPGSEPSNWISLDGIQLKEMPFDSINECREYLDQYEGVTGFHVYGMKSFDFQFIAHTFGSEEIKYNTKHIRVGYLDIETFSGSVDADGTVHSGPFPDPEFAEYPITEIAIYNSVTEVATVFAMPWSSGEKVAELMDHGVTVDLKEYEAGEEFLLLSEFLSYWDQQQFNCWTGWNTEGFDCPYIVNRIKRILGEGAENKLSPWGVVKARKVRDNWGNDFTTYDIVGCPNLDYQQVYQKHTYVTQSSYKLDHIAYVELGENKLDYDENRSLGELYVKNYTRHVNYNIKDTMLVKRLNDKLGLIEVMFALAYSSYSNYGDGLGTVRPWSALAYASLYKQNEIPEITRPQNEDTDYVGAYVKEVVPGRYPWTTSVDLNGLYPHLVQQANMGPETLIKDPVLRNGIIEELIEELNDKMAACEFINRPIYSGLISALRNDKPDIIDELLRFYQLPGEYFETLVSHNVCMTPNIQFFRRDKMSFLSVKFREIYNLRKVMKKRMLTYEQYLADCKNEKAKRKLGERGPDVKFKELEGVIPPAKQFNEMTDAELVAEYNRLDTQFKLHDNLQMAYKIQLNSAYGALGNRWFQPYYDIRIASAITTYGQLVNKWNIAKVNSYLGNMLQAPGFDFAFYGDTDSNYITLGKLVTKMGYDDKPVNDTVDMIDRFMKAKMAPMILEGTNDLCKLTNGYENRMVWEREVIAQGSIFQAKKRYAMVVNDSEGVRYATPKLKFMGLEAKKSSTPEHCRKWLQECYQIGIEGTEQKLQDRVREIKVEFDKMSIEDISQPRSANNLEKYADNALIYSKGTPIAVKAALIYNHLVRSKGHQLPLIHSGDKILFVQLKSPNPLGQAVIGYTGFFPREFELERFVDRELAWAKTFVEPLMNYLTAVGWNHERKASVMDFFS